MQTDLELLQKKRLEPVNERAHASHGMRKRPANSESKPLSAFCADRLSQRSSRSTARILTDTGEVAIVSSAFFGELSVYPEHEKKRSTRAKPSTSVEPPVLHQLAGLRDHQADQENGKGQTCCRDASRPRIATPPSMQTLAGAS